MKETLQPIQENIIHSPLEDVIHNSMMPYAQHVILERALPRVEDGLKPVQRRILYTLYELALTPDKPHRKCARIVGDCLGKYHPHGDISVYDAMVRMAQPFSMRGMLVDGHGNFGSIDGDGAAAMRYTEARMAPLALEMLKDIQKDTVDFQLNFDDTLKEPEVLPARYPNLLVNGANGIAVGLATTIPPHNLREVINACLLLIKNEAASVDDLMELLPGPDFPGGGVLLKTPEIREAYLSGKGKLTLRAKVSIEQGKNGRSLLAITEIPYQVNKANMLSKILKLTESKKAQLGSIYDIRDESDRNGMRAVIELKKDADPKLILAYLYKWSDLQITVGVNMVAIAEGKPMQLSIVDALKYYIEHQRKVLRRRIRFDLEQLKARAHILEGYMLAIDCLDETIQIIRASKTPQQARENLMARFSFTQIQAQAILDLRLQRLTGLELLALQKEYAETKKTIAKLSQILENPKKLDALLSDELTEIAEKYGDDRRTKITVEKEDMQKVVEENLAAVAEATVVLLGNDGLIKRVSPKNHEKIVQAGEESIRLALPCMSDDFLYFFTNIGNVYRMQVSALEENFKIKDKGVRINAILAGLEKDETLVSLLCFDKNSLESELSLLFFTERGLIKKSKLGEYNINRKNFQAIKLQSGDALHAVILEKDGADCFFLSRGGMIIRFALAQVPDMGRVTKGVAGIKLASEDSLLLSGLLEDREELILFSERGYAKRIPVSYIDAQNRGGKGQKAFSFNKTQNNGSYLAGAKLMKEPGSVQIVMKDGETQHFDSEQIFLQSLQDKGKLMVIAILDNVISNIF